MIQPVCVFSLGTLSVCSATRFWDGNKPGIKVLEMQWEHSVFFCARKADPTVSVLRKYGLHFSGLFQCYIVTTCCTWQDTRRSLIRSIRLWLSTAMLLGQKGCLEKWSFREFWLLRTDKSTANKKWPSGSHVCRYDFRKCHLFFKISYAFCIGKTR